MILLQLLLLVFLAFALSRVVMQFHQRQIKLTEFVFWGLLFTSAIAAVVFPNETSRLANLLGISRGVDLVVYASIATLFYLVFRIHVYLEDIRHEITELVRTLALKDKSK